MQPDTNEALLFFQEEQLLSHEEEIKRYLDKEVPHGKSSFCRFFLRGCCLFSTKDCKFAHGAKDLKFKKLDVKEFDRTYNPKGNSEGELKADKTEGDQNEEDQQYFMRSREKQPSLNINPNKIIHRNIYEYQFVLKEKGDIQIIYPKEEIDNSRYRRQAVREKFHRDLQQEFVGLLYREYNTKALKKTFIEKCFQSIDWGAHWKHIVNKNYAYEVKLPQGIVIVKQPPGEEFDRYMEDCIIKIIKENKLLKKTPLSCSLVTKLYYNYLGPLDPYMPSHLIYMRFRDIKSFDDYLNELQNTKSFVNKLALACEVSMEKLEGVSIFNHFNSQLEGLVAQMKAILLWVIEDSSIGFALHSKYEDKVIEECAGRLQQFNGNIKQIKKLMTKIVVKENILVISLNATLYLFSIEKYRKGDLNEVREKCNQESQNGCFLPESNHIALHEMPVLNAEKMNTSIPNKLTVEFLNEQIDLSKIIVVNDQMALKEATEHFLDIDAIGIDLEGALRKNGRLELVQCSSRTKIFVFDIYGVKKMAKEDDKYVGLYKDMALFLKKLIEDPKICKIFHDGRNDFLALHLFLDACPSNVFDLSAVYIFIELLQAYKSQKDTVNDKREEKEQKEERKINTCKVKTKDQKKIEVDFQEVGNLAENIINAPGLNDVLKKYRASHGINQLKEIMKDRFGELPIEYFLQRPLDQEFMVYSAKDVEDLVEIKDTMEDTLRELLDIFNGGEIIEKERVDLLCKKVSNTYLINGCERKEYK